MLPSLSHLALYSIPFQEATTLSPYVRTPDTYSWEFWREKARRDLSPSLPESLFNSYFDLPLTQVPIREISGEERYIELESKIELTPSSLQVFEPLGALYQALLLNQREIVPFLYEHLDDKQIASLRAKVRRESFLEEMAQPVPWGGDIFFFRSGAVRELLKHLYHTYYYQEETLDVLGIKDWHILTEEIAAGELPLRTIDRFGELEREESLLYLISLGNKEAYSLALSNTRKRLATLASGDMDLIKRFPSFSWDDLPLYLVKLPQKGLEGFSSREEEAIFYSGNPPFFYFAATNWFNPYRLPPFSLKTSYFVKKNPLFSFQISSYSVNYLYTEARDIDIDGLVFNKARNEKEKRGLAYLFIEQALGNLNILKTYLPYLGLEEKRSLLERLDLYPLSLELVKSSS